MTRIQVLRSIEKAVAAMPASSKIRATTIRLDPEDPIRLLDVTVERAAPGEIDAIAGELQRDLDRLGLTIIVHGPGIAIRPAKVEATGWR